MDNRNPDESLNKNSQTPSTKNETNNSLYPKPLEKNSSSQLQSLGSTNVSQSSSSKVIKITVGIVIAIIIFGIFLIYRNEATGQKNYKEAKVRCGYNPIVYERGPSFEPYARFTLYPAPPGPDTKFYCNLSEIRADGHDEGAVKSARQTIEVDTEIPANIKSQYLR